MDRIQTERSLQKEKLASEIEKIELEKRALRRQVSLQGVVQSWLQTAAVVVAFTSIWTTLYVGQKQALDAENAARDQRAQIEQNRAADRFDKALTRLANKDDVSVRLTGVAGLRLFMSAGDTGYQGEAAHYLVTAIANEKSQQVQEAIIDSFRGIVGFSQKVKDDSLKTALEMNRNILSSIVLEADAAIKESEKRLFSLYSPRKNDVISNYSSLVDNLSFDQKIQIEDISSHALFPDPDNNEYPQSPSTLDRYVNLINFLLSIGAKNDSNWKNIYCQRCDFTAVKDLSGASFDESYLGSADFSHVVLRGATFRNADLNGTIFFASDLTSADLSWDYSSRYTQINAARVRSNGETFPYLECAVLSGTNLTGLPLINIERSFDRSGKNDPITGELISIPRLRLATIDEKTKIDWLGALLTIGILKSEYLGLQNDLRKRFDMDFFVDNFSWPVGFGMAAGNINLSSLESSIFFVNNEREQMYVKRKVLFIFPGRKIDNWAFPLFQAVAKTDKWDSIPIISSILGSHDSDPHLAAGIYGGGSGNIKDCSPSKIANLRDLASSYKFIGGHK